MPFFCIMPSVASSLGLLLSAAFLSFQGVSVLGEVNVYDEEMSSCGASHAAGCTYAAADTGAHEVCVEKLPPGFSTDTGQGPWSDEFKGQPWCVCIWAYSNYILQEKDLALKCESIPAKVLEEQYSMDKFKQCGKMSSTDGCGAEDIQRSIKSLCLQCGHQAGDEASKKKALKAKCDAILSSAPAAPAQMVDDASASETAAKELDDASSSGKAASEHEPHGASSTTASQPRPVMLAMIIVAMLLIAFGLAMHTHHQRRSARSFIDHCQRESGVMMSEIST